MNDLKKEAARAALTYLKPQQTIGLGAGATISHLIAFINSEIPFKDSLSFVSPSFETETLINDYNLNCLSPSQLKKIDYYFDGCDQVDVHANALKSGGGIHTGEKIYASMADKFILLVDSSKFVPFLNTTFPLCIELIPKAAFFVLSRIESIYAEHKVRVSLRMGDKKNGPVISDNGNFLADVYFEIMPALQELNTTIKALPGVIEHSLFLQIADTVIIAEPNNIKILTANKTQ